MNQVHIGAAFASLAAILAVQPAHASPFYLSAHAGQSTNVAVSGINLGDDATYGGAVGTVVGPFRVEAGVDRLSANFAGVIQAHALDYNATAYLDLPLSSATSVFAGGGVDYLNAEAQSPYGSGMSASGYGYHYALGVAHRLTDHVIGQVEWRRIKSSNLSISGSDVDLTADTVTAGVRVAL